MKAQQRAMFAYLIAAILYLAASYPEGLLPLAPILAGASAGLIAARASHAFLAGLAAGLTALLLYMGSAGGVVLGIMYEAAGALLPLLLFIYHGLAPALVAGGVAGLLGGEKEGG